jgi:hypothetical protein
MARKALPLTPAQKAARTKALTGSHASAGAKAAATRAAKRDPQASVPGKRIVPDVTIAQGYATRLVATFDRDGWRFAA